MCTRDAEAVVSTGMNQGSRVYGFLLAATLVWCITSCGGGVDGERDTTAAGQQASRWRPPPEPGAIGTDRSMPEGSSPERDSRSTARPADGISPETSPEIHVELLDAGREPRRPLRYRFRAPREDVVVADVEMTVKGTVIGTHAFKTTLPLMRTTSRLKSEHVSQEGNLRYTYLLERMEAITGPDTPAAVVEAMETEMKKVEGIGGSALISPRGELLEASFPVPPGADAELRKEIEMMQQQIRMLACPLPEQPLGRGARWKVTTPAYVRGFTVTQTTVFKLIEMDERKARFEVSVTQRARQQPVELPDLPLGARAYLKSLDSSGGGTGALDLERPVVEMEMNLKARTVTSVSVGTQSRDVVNDLEMKTRIYSTGQ